MAVSHGRVGRLREMPQAARTRAGMPPPSQQGSVATPHPAGRRPGAAQHRRERHQHKRLCGGAARGQRHDVKRHQRRHA
ncbi:MAG: hypothetical protein IPK17_15965 [Chloroflexi bacterium]|uniref:hypothetical protein n=1 Tax=Candidatus Flexifilum breve TaxID=3140694 RepID=UPI0031347C8F|nr:hypothetical protein [Chloroflexota bacterium]